MYNYTPLCFSRLQLLISFQLPYFVDYICSHFQEFYVTIFFKEWEDERLNWDPLVDDAEFYFALDTEIWKPELFVDNSYVFLPLSGMLCKIE